MGQTSVNRTDTQTSKVWTIQMMTLILTTTLRVKSNTFSERDPGTLTPGHSH
jgi:hypothetical protein